MVFNGKELCENCFSPVTSDICESCGFSLKDYVSDPTVLAVGTVLQNRYRIGGIIGKGGFGVTYLAFDAKLERRIAVKEYFPYGFAQRGAESGAVMTTGDAQVFKKGAEKFYDEARLIAKFNNTDNIVNVYDVFYENDTVYYVMEYLKGQTLKSIIDKGDRLTPGQAVYIAGQIADALSIAHGMNVLHRDITPDNIMLCSDGKVKLIDFGAARQVVSERSQSLSVILTQGFAPLEQYQKKGKQGPWTDIYSLGATLYFSLTGKIIDDPMSRFEDDTTFQSNPFAVTGELWEIIKKAAAIKTTDRYMSAAELKSALGAISIQPEKIPIPQSGINVKTTHVEASKTGVISEKPAPQPEHVSPKPVSSGSDTNTRPVSNGSDTRTQPVSEGSNMRTMPVSEGSNMRTMPVSDGSNKQTMPVNNNQPAAEKKPKKKKLIPIIAGVAAVLLLIIGIAVGTGDDDSIAANSSDSDSNSSSVSKKVTTTAEEEEDDEPVTTTAASEEAPQTSTTAESKQEPPKTTTTAESRQEPPPPTTSEQNESSEIGWTKMTDSNLKITYNLPDGYVLDDTSTESNLVYQNYDTGSTFFLQFITTIGYPLCSYADVPVCKEDLLNYCLNGKRSNELGEHFEYTSDRNGWMLIFDNELNGITYECAYVFIDSKTDYGCYGFYADWVSGDDETKDIVLEYLDSIYITGTPDGLLSGFASAYRGDIGIKAYGVSAESTFFYSMPEGYTIRGGDGESLFIRKSSSDYVEIYATNQSMERYCDRVGIDQKEIETITYSDNTFDYIVYDFKDGNTYNYIFSKNIGNGRHLKIAVNTSNEDLLWTVENNILPSIHVYD